MKRAGFDFTGETALVTGATKGIGREIALRLAGAGCDLGITGRNRDDLDSLTEEIRGMGRRCVAVRADLSVRDETLDMARKIDDELGGVRILINNAGMAITETILELDPDHWDALLAVNLTAPALISSIIAPGMVERKSGVIVNISSVAGTNGLTEHAAYCASKFGLNGLTKVMALELGPHGVRVNAVSPTVTLTPMGQQVWGKPEKGDPMRAKIPLGKFAYPEDIADAVLFLSSGSASMINGDVLLIDGGYSAQ